MEPLFGNQTFTINEFVQSQFMEVLVKAVNNFVNAHNNKEYLFIEQLFIPVMRSVFALEDTVAPEHEELVDICRNFLMKHRVTVSSNPKIGNKYAVALIPKRPLDELEEGDSMDASWTINDPSIGTRVAIKVDTKLLHGLVNRFAPLQVSTEDQEEIDETYHVLWEDSTTSELYGHEEYLNAKALFDSSLEQFRKPRTKFSKSRIYVDDYEICFNSNWFEAAIEYYDSPTFATCENMNTFIVLGFVKFLHELFHTFTDFILDSEWFYKQRATSTVIQRYPATPPRIGVRFANSKHLLGDLGYAAEEILFGNHRRLKVTLDPGTDWWLPNMGIFFEIGEVQAMEASESSLVTSVAKFQRSGQSSSKQQHGLKTPRTKTPKQKTVIKTASKRIASYSEIHAIEGKQESGDVKEEEEMAIISEERFEKHSDRIKYQMDNCKRIESIAFTCSGEDFMGLFHGFQVTDELLEPVPNIKPLRRRFSKKDKSRKFAEGLSLADLYAEDFPSMALDFQDEHTSLDFRKASIAKLPVDSRGRTIKP